jgi:tetratricopeptide (TPR) repeat protein
MERLRATFLAGPRANIRAQDIFTDRVTEVEAFREAVRTALSLQSSIDEDPNIDMTIPRRNVMVYYGYGGIGKTTLSRQIERRLTEADLGMKIPKYLATTRVDFGESGEFDLEATLLRFRSNLGELRKGWPAFDLAFQLYWERQHPGQSLPEFLHQNSFLRHHLRRLDFIEEMQNILAQVMSELGMAWTPTRIAFRLASLTQDHLMRSVTYRRLSSKCPFLEPIVTADSPADALSYTPALLGWELSQINRPYLVVFFFDTFEAICGRSTREVERIVQRLIFLLPTVLFVITSRNHLDWSVPSTTNELDYRGINRWSQLDLANKESEPRQHLIALLAPEDADLYLRSVLQNEDGSPMLDDDLRDRIVSGSQGLPLYLDLSVKQYLELRAGGVAITPEVFGGSLSSVVSRILRNLDNEERNILRGVSLLDAFDVDLAHAASNAPDAKIGRFVNSSLIAHTTGRVWPYVVHEQFRRTIQDSDSELSDAWSQREWREAADRICAYLGELSQVAQSGRDSAKVGACFTQAVRLSNLYQSIPSWVLEAAQFLADTGSWRSLDVRLSASAEQSPATTALVQGLRGISLRRDGSLEESIAQFGVALSSPTLQSQSRDLLRLHRAHSIRNSGEYDRARREYEEILEETGPYATRAALQLADIYLLRGQFLPALQALESIPEDNPDILGESLRVRGHVYRANGNFDNAELTYRRVLELAKQIQSPALEGKALTNLAETLCWMKPTEGQEFADRAIAFNSAIGNQLEVLKANVARAVSSERDKSEEYISAALTLADKCKYRAGSIFALAARVFHEIIPAQRPNTSDSSSILIIANSINAYHYWYDIVTWWLNDSPSTVKSYPTADWLGDEELAKRRWLTVLSSRRTADE